jgi:hypothetical protein
VRRHEHAAPGGRRGRPRHHPGQGGLNRRRWGCGVRRRGRKGSIGWRILLGFCRLCMWRGKEERRRRACGRGDEGDYVVQRRVGFWTNHATSVYGPNGFICSSSISQGKFFFLLFR